MTTIYNNVILLKLLWPTKLLKKVKLPEKVNGKILQHCNLSRKKIWWPMTNGFFQTCLRWKHITNLYRKISLSKSKPASLRVKYTVFKTCLQISYQVHAQEHNKSYQRNSVCSVHQRCPLPACPGPSRTRFCLITSASQFPLPFRMTYRSRNTSWLSGP